MIGRFVANGRIYEGHFDISDDLVVLMDMKCLYQP